MKCIYCKKETTKNGHDKLGMQRLKCTNCKKTFSINHSEFEEKNKEIRLVLHLLLAGVKLNEIAEVLGISIEQVKLSSDHLFRGYKKIIPNKQLLSVNTLKTLFNALEKSRIAGISNMRSYHFKRRKK